MRGDENGPINIIRDSVLLDVTLSANGNVLEGITIRRNPPKNSIMGPKEEFIECSVLLCCSNEQCDIDTFAAVNDSGLVFDGGVVVDEVRLCSILCVLIAIRISAQ